jgi:hypothetical protein
MTLSHNLDFPPVYKRLRDRAVAFGVIATALYFLITVSGTLAYWIFGVEDEIFKGIGLVILIPFMVPSMYFFARQLILKFRAIYATSPLCPLCAAKMLASDGAAASSTGPSMPADPGDMFACPRCSHAASRAELKAAWRDVT